MKYLLSILFTLLSLNADYLLVTNTTNSTNAYCIKSYYYEDNNLVYQLSNADTLSVVNLQNISNYSISSGYQFKDNKCDLINGKLSSFTFDENLPMTTKNLNYLGLDDSQLAFLMGLSGVMCSGFLLFGIFRLI